MTCPELRITDTEIAEVRRGPICERLDGNLPPGASARIGAVLVAAMPHLRHAKPPTTDEWWRLYRCDSAYRDGAIVLYDHAAGMRRMRRG